MSADRQDSFAAAEETARRANELLGAVARQCKGLLRESEAEAERRACEITEDAGRQARELLEEAELEAKGIVVASSRERAQLLSELAQERSALEEARTKLGSSAATEEAPPRANELLAAAREREVLRRESEAEAERITEHARRQARDLLEEAEREATRIVDAAGQERAQLMNELAHERSVWEETRTRISGFLVDVLEEVEGAPAASEEPANVPTSARRGRTPAGADH